MENGCTWQPHMVPCSSGFKRTMLRWKQMKNVCYRSWEAKNLGRTTIRYVTLAKKWKRPTMEWKRFISVGNVVHGTRTWNYVHPGGNEPCYGENRWKTWAIGHGRRKHRPNDHSACNPGQKMETAHNEMETVHFGRKCCTWHPHMELCPFSCKRTMVGWK